MKTDLSSFYHTKKWRKLVDILKLERIDEDGQIICTYCGKPIVMAYDCIGHHVVHLTEENVNDASVSLNPDNIQLVHHSCHNRIHNKLGYSRREVWLIYGAPLSGKSSYVSSVCEPGDLIIDLDNIWQMISGCRRYEKPNRLKSVAFRIRDDLLDVVRYRFGKWQNAYIIGGYPLSSERERLCRELGAREIYIDTSYEECINRLETCEDRDKDEWNKYIRDWFDRYIPPAGDE